MSDDADFSFEPVKRGRRVSMLVAIPIVAGCAAVGTLAGIVYPLRPPPEVRLPSGAAPPSSPPAPHVRGAASKAAGPSEAPAVTPGPAVPEPVKSPIAPEPPLRSGQMNPPAPAPVPPAEEPPAVRLPDALKTGSVEPPSRTGVEEPAASSREASTRPTAVGERLARVKRLRRVYMRRMGSKAPGSDVNKFFSSIFPLNKQ